MVNTRIFHGSKMVIIIVRAVQSVFKETIGPSGQKEEGGSNKMWVSKTQRELPSMVKYRKL